MTYKTRPSSVVIDGQNAARSKNGKACWNHVRLAVLHFCEIQIPVILVMPHWDADIEFKKEIRKVAKLQLVDTENDLILMGKIFENFCTSASPLPDLEKVIEFLDTHPDVAQINASVHQKNWRT